MHSVDVQGEERQDHDPCKRPIDVGRDNLQQTSRISGYDHKQRQLQDQDDLEVLGALSVLTMPPNQSQLRHDNDCSMMKGSKIILWLWWEESNWGRVSGYHWLREGLWCAVETASW